MNISQFYGKKIVSLTGKKGYIISAYASEDKMEYLLCVDGNEREFKVDIKNIVSVKNEVTYKRAGCDCKNARPIRLGRAGFSEYGKLLGIIEDVIFNKNKLTHVKIGKRKYPADRVILGDVAIVKEIKKVKSDIVKDGTVLIKKGTPLTEEVLSFAAESGEYVQTNLKSL